MSLIPGVQLVRRADGSVAQLHALGMLKDGSRWLAYGEIKTGGSRFGGICCYATEDFVHWRDLGCALPVGASGGMTSPERIVERPRVLRCPANGLYVMYLHVDGEGDYRYAHVGTAVSERPEGPFQPLSTMRFGMNASRAGIWFPRTEIREPTSTGFQGTTCLWWRTWSVGVARTAASAMNPPSSCTGATGTTGLVRS